eukprot:94724-Prymnesium_polylepis.2
MYGCRRGVCLPLAWRRLESDGSATGNGGDWRRGRAPPRSAHKRVQPRPRLLAWCSDQNLRRMASYETTDGSNLTRSASV